MTNLSILTWFARHGFIFVCFLFLSYLLNVLTIACGVGFCLTNFGAVRSMKNKFQGVGVAKQITQKKDDKKSSSFDDEKVCIFEFSVNTKNLEDEKSIETRGSL